MRRKIKEIRLKRKHKDINGNLRKYLTDKEIKGEKRKEKEIKETEGNKEI